MTGLVWLKRKLDKPNISDNIAETGEHNNNNKKLSVEGFTGTSQMVRETKSPILMSLALLMWKLQTNIWCPGQIDPCLPEIGLKSLMCCTLNFSEFSFQYALS